MLDNSCSVLGSKTQAISNMSRYGVEN